MIQPAFHSAQPGSPAAATAVGEGAPPAGRRSTQATTSKAVRILLVEDSPTDAALVEESLREGGVGTFQFTRAVSWAEAVEQLRAQPFDVLLLDLSLPDTSGRDTFVRARARAPHLPIIVLTGLADEAVGLEAVRQGVQDYITKDQVSARHTGRAIRYAIERKQAEEALKEAQISLRQQERELRELNLELERRVAGRTADLLAANAKLQAAMTARKRLEQELLEITEKERRRIGLDLHDDLGQKLSGLALMTKGLERRLTRRRAAEAREAAGIHALVQQAMNHARDLAQDLTALDSTQTELAGLLKDLAVHARKLFRISCEVKVAGAMPPLDVNTINQLYKIAQEAVTNAFKHAKAKRVRISLTPGAHDLVLRVQNDGQPFPDLRDHSKGMGLRIMNYRAHLIGASLRIEGAGARGTSVTCTLPLAAAK